MKKYTVIGVLALTVIIVCVFVGLFRTPKPKGNFKSEGYARIYEFLDDGEGRYRKGLLAPIGFIETLEATKDPYEKMKLLDANPHSSWRTSEVFNWVIEDGFIKVDVKDSISADRVFKWEDGDLIEHKTNIRFKKQ